MTQISKYFDIKRDSEGREYMEVYLDGIALLRLVLTNKGTAFSHEERIALGLDGLLPPQVNTLEQQIDRVYRGFQRESTDLAKYQFLRALQERTELLFYALLEKHLEEMLPIIYTPTVGQAVQEYSARYQSPRGLSFSPLNIHRAGEVVKSYPWNDVRMIVATDSSAILGLGDQGYGGLAICVGKLAIYTVGGGVSPFKTLPVKLDVGTNRLDLINDPFYLGIRQRRLRGEDYYEFLDRFVDAVLSRWPKTIIQWEDLAKDVAFKVLERYRDKIPCFNDDIQGTGAVALAGVLSACRLKNESMRDQRIIVFGAGAGGIGVASAMIDGLVREGLTRDEAVARVFVLDSRGLLMEGRAMDPYKAPFAQAADRVAEWKYDGSEPTLMEVIENASATVLLGLSGQASAFNRPIVEAVSRNTSQPIIFPLSNPTSISEALPEDIFEWTNGQAIVATGSPFEDVIHGGKVCPIGQGNNAFIFPGLGFAAVLCEVTKVTDKMVLESAYALADYTAAAHLGDGRVYPPIADLQEVSIRVATRVVECALEEGVAQRRELENSDIDTYLRKRFWKPRYIPFMLGRSTEKA